MSQTDSRPSYLNRLRFLIYLGFVLVLLNMLRELFSDRDLAGSGVSTILLFALSALEFVRLELVEIRRELSEMRQRERTDADRVS